MDPITLTADSGQVSRALTRDDLAQIEARYQVPDVGQLASGRQGRAVRLSGLLDLLGIEDGVRFVHVESSDGSFTANIPIEDARAGGLVLYALDDGPLPERFGGPFRLLFPDDDDCSVSVKFLGRIDLVREPGSHTARCADD